MPWRHIARRLLLGVVTLVLVSIVIFVATTVLPGDAARAILGHSATPESVALLQAKLGLDRPPLIRYATWIGGLARWNLGTSLVTNLPVWAMVKPRLANTLMLLAATSILALPVSFGLGIVMAIRPGRLFDSALNSLLVGIAGVPEFVLGIVLVVLLSTQVFHVFPATSLVPPGTAMWQHPAMLALPVMTLTLAIIPYMARLVRASLIDALASEYVVTARLKGLPERVVLLRHALRNSLVPAIQGGALSLAYILGGAVVVEFIFQYPGLGSALQEAVQSRDLSMIQAIVLIFAAGYVTFNLAADVLTILVTPRLRT